MAEGKVYLVISDLHLSEGRDPDSGRVSRREDFLFDEEFDHFLRYYETSTQYSDRLILVINGDFVDFLQVTSQPEDESLNLSGDPVYGLRTGPRESAWKLGKIIEGHPLVFRALARFASRHRVVFVVGNHDVSLSFPQVQEALVSRLQELGVEGQGSRIAAQVSFQNWFYFDGLLYAEHGHQYDALNSFTYVLDPTLDREAETVATDSDEIDLPFGSLFVRYLFNRIETVTPFADNIKPPTRFLPWYLLHHPFHAYGFLFTDGIEMLRRVKKRWKRGITSNGDDRASAYESRFREFASRIARDLNSTASVWEEKLKALDELRTPSVLHSPKSLKWRLIRFLTGPVLLPVIAFIPILFALLGLGIGFFPLLRQVLPFAEHLDSLIAAFPLLGLLADVVRWIFLCELILLIGLALRSQKRISHRNERIVLREKAAEIQRITQASVVIMGHSHDTDLWRVNGEAKYVNTGTWTRVFSNDAAFIREEKELTFALVIQDEITLRVKLMRWEAGSGTPRLAYLFKDS